ncbi:MAG: hypothetical protein QMD44_03890 [Thermodesulfovibrionales bacterium]|jgi:Cu/Ag efflux protein CusF|nr:hypothetical protein [Thermodesulfovibrionales bacterium]
MRSKTVTVLLGTILCIAMLIGLAIAAEKIKGTIKNIDSGAGTVVVTDSNGKDVTLILEDKGKLGKYSIGDKIKGKYESKSGKNVATDFRKAEGC